MGGALNGVRITFEQLTHVAADMRKQAGITRGVIAKLNTDAEALRPTWDGTSRGAFDTCYHAFSNEVKHVPLMLDEIGAALDEAALLLKQGDEAAQVSIGKTVVSDTAV